MILFLSHLEKLIMCPMIHLTRLNSLVRRQNLKTNAEIFVADIVVLDKTSIQIPTVKGRSNSSKDNVEAISIPFLYNSSYVVIIDT